MSDKKYLLTESDIRQIKDLECGWYADNAGGNFNCADASNAEQERFLEAHEYHERTCQMKKARWDDGQCTWGVICSDCGEKHEHEFEYSFNFCPTCGAKVVDDETL